MNVQEKNNFHDELIERVDGLDATGNEYSWLDSV